MEAPIIKILVQKLGSEKLLTGQDVQDRYYHVWAMASSLEALAVALPKTTEDVSNILRICHEHNQPVIIHGGLTGLVGSTRSSKLQLVISLEKMNSIEEIDVQSRTMSVQSGVILENIQRAALEKDLLFPLNFGAKGSAQIGGAISTNAGGLRVFRYGQTRDLILGLEAVLADGAIISSIKKIIKDNSGYDIKQLFIGSEGTLGVVTRAVIKLSEAPKSQNSVFVGLKTYEQVVTFLKFMDAGLGGTLSAFEILWPSFYDAMTKDPINVSAPLPHGYPYYVLMDSLSNDKERDKLQIEALLEIALEKEIILDAVIGDTESDQQWFWNLREEVGKLAPIINNMQAFDISIPIPEIGAYIDNIVSQSKAIPEIEKVISFGHVADGNIHLVFSKSSQNDDLVHRINELVYLPLKDLGGSISAEHGIGIDKKKYLYLSRSENEVRLMKTIKKALDPKGILNPHRIFD